MWDEIKSFSASLDTPSDGPDDYPSRIWSYNGRMAGATGLEPATLGFGEFPKSIITTKRKSS
jgi:hypothetical protein